MLFWPPYQLTRRTNKTEAKLQKSAIVVIVLSFEILSCCPPALDRPLPWVVGLLGRQADACLLGQLLPLHDPSLHKEQDGRHVPEKEREWTRKRSGSKRSRRKRSENRSRSRSKYRGWSGT